MAYRKTEGVKAHLKARRESIITAATAVVAKHGRERLLARTVERSGVSMGAIYQYFADVDELWAAVVASALARDVAAIGAKVDDERYPLNALARAIAVFYSSLDKPRLARALAESPAYCKGIRTALEPFLADLGFTPRARSQLASAILGALYGMFAVDASAKDACTFALQGIGTPKASASALAHGAV